MFAKNMLLPCLLDIYGALLTDRKRELLEYYYDDDYSLAEISELTGISRQGVRDSIKKSEAELAAFEERLHLHERITVAEECIVAANEIIDELAASTDSSAHNTLASLKAKLSALDELLRN